MAFLLEYIKHKNKITRRYFMQPYHSLLWTENNTLQLLDQRLLPQEISYLTFVNYNDTAQAIKDMVVRGAPAIGAAAAYGCALAVYHNPSQNIKELLQELEKAFHVLAASRPTAVNLHWAWTE
jgi:methylthioribose-1-phosphate isomerase